MKVTPEYKSFGELFSENNIFETPTYQRDYSWESEQISQFCDDISKSLGEEGKTHFFGGIVCAQEEAVGNKKIPNVLVDGQQRLSTIVLFFSVFNRLLSQLEIDGDDAEFRNEIVSDIQKYLVFEERVQREKISHKRIKIGKSDDAFFQSSVEGVKLKIERESHKLIWNAKVSFEEFIEKSLWLNRGVSDSLEIADKVVKLFDENFLLIHIITTTVDEAYKLFMVLNDRGINLTEGELLKAHTVGGFSEDQYVRRMAEDWDLVLASDTKSVTDYLRWILIMIEGDHISATDVLDRYRSKFLKCEGSSSDMADKVSFIRECCDILKLIANAEWPFENTHSGTSFYRSKLDLLIKKLQHKHAMPVLLAAYFSGESNFKNVVNEIYRFFVRYKIISNLHASVFSNLYSRLSKEIFESRDRYNIRSLIDGFSQALNQKDPDDEFFKAGLKSLVYRRKGDNRPLKYVFITVQENWRWLVSPVSNNISKRSRMEDHSIVFDFNNTTIEHLYPYSSRSQDEDMEQLKNRIGNLTILEPGRNRDNDNKDFSDKSSSFINTGVGIHEFIASKTKWGKDEFDELEGLYVEYALKAFSFQ